MRQSDSDNVICICHAQCTVSLATCERERERESEGESERRARATHQTPELCMKLNDRDHAGTWRSSILAEAPRRARPHCALQPHHPLPVADNSTDSY